MGRYFEVLAEVGYGALLAEGVLFFQAEDGIRDDLVTGSSDVCSSDLQYGHHGVIAPTPAGEQRGDQIPSLLHGEGVEEDRRRPAPATAPGRAPVQQLVAGQAHDQQGRANPLREVLDEVEHAV